ncbi:MAG TPA: asparagine synthase-related protein [Thermoanaerobaculia bacterium]
MSGFVYAVRFDDVPVDPALVAELQRLLARRPHVAERTDFARAYAAWGDDCVQRLPLEFSFAVWDAARKRLFAARDRLGTRPLFYATTNGTLIVTNDFPTLIDASFHTRALHRDAIADFFAHGYNTDLTRTVFAQIRRVPPGHRLIASAEGVRVERWWELPFCEEPLRIGEREAVERFRDVFGTAVRERAQGRVAIGLSGGVDSTTVAATLVANGGRATAITTVWDPLIPDVERHYATVAARALQLPHELQECAAVQPFDGWESRHVRGLEPFDDPFSVVFNDFLRRAAAHGDVLLTGQGGDPALYASHDYFFRLLRGGRWLRFLTDALGFAVTRQRLPPLLLRSRLLRLFRGGRNGAGENVQPPPWLRDDLRARFMQPPRPSDSRTHVWRADAHRLLSQPVWSAIFEGYDPGASGHAVRIAPPWFDARVLEFLFSLPPMPHFGAKDLARNAVKGLLPDEVRLRAKTPLRGDPLFVLFRRTPERWVEIVESAPRLDEFVDRRILCSKLLGSAVVPDDELRQQAAAVALGKWLQGLS